MSKGIREAAMSPDKPAQHKLFETDYDYGTYLPTKPYKGYGQYDTPIEDYDYDTAYGAYNDSTYYGKKTYKQIEDVRLAPGTFEISLAIPMDSLGQAGNPDDIGFEYAAMLDLAERTAIIQVTKLIPNVKENYSLSTDSVENIDDVTVMVTLTPKVF
jgi:hypothetical protein